MRIISIIIATYNRSRKLRICLRSINKSGLHDYEVILVDQSSNSKTKKLIKSLNNRKIRYFKQNIKNKSIALNYGIDKARGDIIVFTDDDCIVSTDWLSNIYLDFSNHENIVGLFGNVIPYNASQKKYLTCPSKIIKNNFSYISKPQKHWLSIGIGSNMAYRRYILQKLGYFEVLLGPGSIGYACEDADFAFRVIQSGYKVAHDPKVIVFHNRWVDENRAKIIANKYLCGESAVYGYLNLLGITLGKKVILKEIKYILIKFKEGYSLLIKHPRISLLGFYFNTIRLGYFTKGLAIAILLLLKRSFYKKTFLRPW